MDLIIINSPVFSKKDLVSPLTVYKYFAHGFGPFTTTLVDAVGVIHSSLVDPLKSSPDLEFMVMMTGASFDFGIFSRNSLGISKKVKIDLSLNLNELY